MALQKAIYRVLIDAYYFTIQYICPNIILTSITKKYNVAKLIILLISGPFVKIQCCYVE